LLRATSFSVSGLTDQPPLLSQIYASLDDGEIDLGLAKTLPAQRQIFNQPQSSFSF
jgi:hypothetical protein